MDPLRLLREFTMANKPVILVNSNEEIVNSVAQATKVSFDTHTFPRQAPTAFRKGAAGEDVYTLDTLIFLVQNAHLDNSAYFKECRAQDIEHVSIIDKKKILDYLTGKIDSLPNIADVRTSGKRPRDEDEKDLVPADKKGKTTTSKADDAAFVKGVLAIERVLKTKESVMRGTRDFSSAIALTQKLLFGKGVGRSSSKSGSRHSSSQPSQHTTKLSSKDKIPLIIVPAAPTAKLTLYNIKQFLEESKFVDSQTLRESGVRKPEQVTVERRKPDGQIVPYHVVDSIVNLKQSDWDRVCCVFVTGQAWQFKGWKWERPLELFQHVKGFYPRWDGTTVEGQARNWAVADVEINRNWRHMDRASVAQLWDQIDRYNANHKSFLNF
ncbi:accessory factor associated with RNA polymerase II [Apophysomyces ossiformis]|uniref:Accessory factor associated with RNA polymerase II n=1 Tax=Apophysomyces ossiformis TaxID=679940 RepID=A0A8H7BYW7_9FUNG|nr:accessory factor associated with RNA polymerase II [Apophysomyces ossiformis]